MEHDVDFLVVGFCGLQILYRNVAHPKLAAYIETHSWLSLSGDYLTFPQNQSLFKGKAHHYVDSIEEVRFSMFN